MNALALLLISLAIIAHFEAAEEKDIALYLWKNKEQDEPLNVNRTTLAELVDKDATIVVLLHGWLETAKEQWIADLKNAFLSKTDKKRNVVLVSRAGFIPILYTKELANSRDVGRIMGEIIVELSEKQGIPLKQFYVVGSCVGGQTAGFIGKSVFKISGKKLPVVTSLDPAAPLIDVPWVADDDKLNKNDAEVVTVLHTDGGVVGVLRSVGTVDIFINGGSGPQPGCPNLAPGDIRDNIIFCNHKKVNQYYIDALKRPGSLIATECDSYKSFLQGKCSGNRKIDIAAELTPQDAGNYYITITKKEAPFS